MKVLIAFDHPRRDSFCGSVLDCFADGLAVAGHVPEIADLRGEDFDPRMPVADEPDWGCHETKFSPEVLREQARIERNDAIAFVFPVWWWSFPATTKGWIDRVWNYGWAYSGGKLKHRKALLIGVNAGDQAGYEKRGYDGAMRTQLITGIVNYCGIADASLEMFYDVFESAELRKKLLIRAHDLGRSF